MIAAVHEGFGRTNVSSGHISDTRKVSLIDIKTTCSSSNAIKLLYASDILYIAVEYSSRLVVGLMFIRLSASSTQKIVSWIIIGSCGVFGIASVVTFAIQSIPFRTMNVADPGGLVLILPTSNASHADSRLLARSLDRY